MSDKNLEEKKNLTVKQTANYLNRSETTIYNMLKEGSIPGTKLGGKWVVNRPKLDKQLEENSNFTSNG